MVGVSTRREREKERERERRAGWPREKVACTVSSPTLYYVDRQKKLCLIP